MSRIQSTVQWRTLSAAALVLGLLAPALQSLQAQAAPTRKPTVAVLEFDNAAMVKKDEFAAMTIGSLPLRLQTVAELSVCTCTRWTAGMFKA